jgi:hypothetical protein
VAGCTGGAEWSAAKAGSTNPMTRSGNPRTTFIVLDCII